MGPNIYFDAGHVTFFPTDAIGGRGGNEYASGMVTIEAADRTVDTDIRQSSTERVSPRKSFKIWMTSVGAVDGGTARLHRVSDRQSKLEYLD